MQKAGICPHASTSHNTLWQVYNYIRIMLPKQYDIPRFLFLLKIYIYEELKTVLARHIRYRWVFKFSKIQTLQVLEFSIIYYYFLCICPCYFSKYIATQDAEGDANSFLRNSTYFVCGQEVREKNFFSMTTAIYF